SSTAPHAAVLHPRHGPRLGAADHHVAALRGFAARPPGRGGGPSHFAPQRQPHADPAHVGRDQRRVRHGAGVLAAGRRPDRRGGLRATASKIAPMRRVTLTQFLVGRQQKDVINADLRLLLETIARACKAISTRVNKGALADGVAFQGASNVHGELQKKLDVLSNEILLEANVWGGNLAAFASEEEEKPVPITEPYKRGEYLLLIDPLDGSSNIDVNISVGTIFSVLRCPKS